MTSPDEVTVTTLVAVEPAQAFELFTAEVDVWWKRGPRFRFGEGREGEMRFEPGVGGRFLEVFADGDQYEVGEVLAWQPADRLEFEFRPRSFREDEKTTVEVRFAAEGESTRVTLVHRGWSELAADHPARHGLRGTALEGLIGTFWAELLVAHQARARKSR